MIPEKNIPYLHKLNKCYELKNLNTILNYTQFEKDILYAYQPMINSKNLTKFIHTCEFMWNTVGTGIFVCILNGKLHSFQYFANITSIKPSLKKLTHKKNIIKIKKNLNVTTIGIDKNVTRKKWLHHRIRDNCRVLIKKKWWEEHHYTPYYYDILDKTLVNSNINTCFFK